MKNISIRKIIAIAVVVVILVGALTLTAVTAEWRGNNIQKVDLTRSGITDEALLDLNGNGAVGSGDLELIMSILTGDDKDVTDEQRLAADLYADGVVDIKDYNYMYYLMISMGIDPELPDDYDPVIVVSGSDFQSYGGAEAAGATFGALLKSIKNDYSNIDGFLFAGDYSVDIPAYVGNYNTNQQGIDTLKRILHATYGEDMHEVYVEGNHDLMDVVGISESGNNDPESGEYGVFVINEDDFMWQSNTGWSEKYKGSGLTAEQIVKQTAANLDAYLNEKLDEGFDKPIFIVSHLALHYSMRTRIDGDEMYANYIFDVINDACYKGLDVIYLFGHNHSQGWDEYLGGGSIYLPVGSDIKIANASKTDYSVRTLAFTYMNAGYVGYYSDCRGADDTLTMCAFEIYRDKVIVNRYDDKGIHKVMKAAGAVNTPKGEDYAADPTVYLNPQTIRLHAEKPVPQRFVDETTGVAVTTLSKNVTVKELDLAEVDDFTIQNFVPYKAYTVIIDDDVSGYVKVELPLNGLDSARKRVYVYNGKKYVRLDYTLTDDNCALIQTDMIEKIVVAGSVDDVLATYTKVNVSANDLAEGTYVILYNGDIMAPSVVDKSNGSGARRGFDLVSKGITTDTIADDLSEYEWTLTKSGSGWLLGSANGYAKLTNTSDVGVAATLEADGDIFTITGSGTYNFSNGSYVLNYNSRGLINGYANQPAGLELYIKSTGGSYEYKKIADQNELKDGETYVLVLNNITPTKPTAMPTGSYAMMSEALTPNGLNYMLFDEDDVTSEGIKWLFTASGSGYTVQAVDGPNKGLYINLNGNKSLSLSAAPQTLNFNLTGSGEGMTIKDTSGSYRIRFTSDVDGVSAFTGGTDWNNCYFQIYQLVTGSQGGVYDGPDPYETPVNFGLYAGGWNPKTSISVDDPGTYTLSTTSIDSNDWVLVKNTAGETASTTIPAGTIIRTTELKLNGEPVTFNGGKTYFDYKVGANGEIEMIYFCKPIDKDYVDSRPDNITSVEVTFIVDYKE